MTAAADQPIPLARPDTAMGGGFTAAGLLFGAATVLGWASHNVAAKHGIDAGFTPVDLSALRFGLAGLVLIPMLVFWTGLRGRLPSLRHTLGLTLLGGPLFSVLAVSGYTYAPLTHGIVFAPAANFTVGSLLGVLWLGEKVGRRHIFGGLIMLCGLAVLSGIDARTLGPETLKGDLLFLATGSLWAVFTVLMRRWRVDPVGGVVAMGSVSCLLAAPMWLALGGGRLFEMPAFEVGIQVVAQGLIGGLAASFAFFAAVRALGAARASLLGPIVPGTALMMAAAVYATAPRLVDLAGVGLVTAGLLVATLRRRPLA